MPSPANHQMNDQSEALKVGEVKQCYTGSKSFWRTRQTIDIAIFEQYVPSGPQFPVKTHVVQIVAFDPSLNKEAPHLFIESEKLCKLFQKRAVVNDVAMQEEMIPGEKYAQTQYVKYILNRIAITDDSDVPAKVPFLQSEKFDDHISIDGVSGMEILNKTPRMSLEEELEQAKNKKFEIVLVALTGDVDMIFTTVRPEGLSPLPCLKHHRRTGSVLNPVEFKRKLSFIRRSSLIINTDLLQADKLSDISESALQVFDTIHKMVIKKKSVPNTNSIAKQRWLKAINFVIIRIGVARTKAMLDAMEARKRNFLNSPPLTDQHMRSPGTGKGRKSSAAKIDAAILAVHLPNRDVVTPMEHEHFPPVNGNHKRSPPTSAKTADDMSLSTSGSTAKRSNSLPGTGKMAVSKSVATISSSPTAPVLPQIAVKSKSPPARHA